MLTVIIRKNLLLFECFVTPEADRGGRVGAGWPERERRVFHDYLAGRRMVRMVRMVKRGLVAYCGDF